MLKQSWSAKRAAPECELMVASITPARPQTTAHWHIHTETTSTVPRHRRLVDMQLLRVLYCPDPVPYPLLLCPGICRCRHGVVVAGRNIKFWVIYTGQTEAGNISAAVHVARGVCAYACVCEQSDTQGVPYKGVGFSCWQSELSQSWRFFSFSREVCRWCGYDKFTVCAGRFKFVESIFTHVGQ